MNDHASRQETKKGTGYPVPRNHVDILLSLDLEGKAHLQSNVARHLEQLW